MEKTRSQHESRCFSNLRSELLKPLSGVLQVLRRGGSFHQQQKRLLVRRLFLENVNRLVPRFLKAHEIKVSQPQLQSDVQILGLQLLRSAEEGIRCDQPPLFEADQPQPRDSDWILRIEPKDVHVLDLRLLVFLGLKVPVGALQMAIFLCLTRTTE